jgi:hypothetical protein
MNTTMWMPLQGGSFLVRREVHLLCKPRGFRSFSHWRRWRCVPLKIRVLQESHCVIIHQKTAFFDRRTVWNGVFCAVRTDDIYIYIYIYIERERERQRELEAAIIKGTSLPAKSRVVLFSVGLSVSQSASRELLWSRRGENSGTQWKRNASRCKPSPEEIFGERRMKRPKACPGKLTTE